MDAVERRISEKGEVTFDVNQIRSLLKGSDK